MRRFYSLLTLLLAPVAFGIVVWRGFRDRSYWVGLMERFGWGGDSGARATLWIHAVSLGEVTAAAALIRALRARHPALHVELTTATPTGRTRAQALFRDTIGVRFLPYDTAGSVKRFLDRVDPCVAIIMETELWPNLFRECERRQIPVLLASARLSPKSVARYLRFGKLFRSVFSANTKVAAQTQEDAQRYIEIGADPATTSVLGNVKFDFEIGNATIEQGQAFRARNWGSRATWVAGSTHAGEEEQVLDAHVMVLAAVPEALLLLVPRHPDRFAAVADVLTRRGLRFQRRTSDALVQADTQVLLIDTVGELIMMYAAADVVFVGGSLVPIGGHNLIEPATLGLPVLTGPYNANGREVARLLFERHAALQVDDAEALAAELRRLFADPVMQFELGENALAVVEENRGSVARLLDLIAPMLVEHHPAAVAAGLPEASH